MSSGSAESCKLDTGATMLNESSNNVGNNQSGILGSTEAELLKSVMEIGEQMAKTTRDQDMLDIAQEVAMKIWQGKFNGKFKAEKSSLRSFAFVIVLNAARTRNRSRARYRKYLDQLQVQRDANGSCHSTDGDGLAAAVRSELSERVQEAIFRLEPLERLVVLNRFFPAKKSEAEGMSNYQLNRAWVSARRKLSSSLDTMAREYFA